MYAKLIEKLINITSRIQREMPEYIETNTFFPAVLRYNWHVTLCKYT